MDDVTPTPQGIGLPTLIDISESMAPIIPAGFTTGLGGGSSMGSGRGSDGGLGA